MNFIHILVLYQIHLQVIQKYVDYVIDRFNLKSTNSQIIEIASNDGYLLQFLKKNFNCLELNHQKVVQKQQEKKT